jgi:hypothetical protein
LSYPASATARKRGLLNFKSLKDIYNIFVAKI